MRANRGQSTARAWRRSVVGALLLSFLPLEASAQQQSIPSLKRNGEAIQLMVADKPYIALAGEVHNSAASSAAHMRGVWEKLAAQHLNTAIIPIYWEQVEPTADRFDFRLIDDHLRQARAHDMRVVFLWFGTMEKRQIHLCP